MKLHWSASHARSTGSYFRPATGIYSYSALFICTQIEALARLARSRGGVALPPLRGHHCDIPPSGEVWSSALVSGSHQTLPRAGSGAFRVAPARPTLMSGRHRHHDYLPQRRNLVVHAGRRLPPNSTSRNTSSARVPYRTLGSTGFINCSPLASSQVPRAANCCSRNGTVLRRYPCFAHTSSFKNQKLAEANFRIVNL